MQLQLFADAVETPQASVPALGLRRYCTQCRRAPRAFCAACRTRTVAFDDTYTCLHSHTLRETHADSVTLRLRDAAGAMYEFTSSVTGVREHMGLLTLAGV